MTLLKMIGSFISWSIFEGGCEFSFYWNLLNYFSIYEQWNANWILWCKQIKTSNCDQYIHVLLHFPKRKNTSKLKWEALFYLKHKINEANLFSDPHISARKSDKIAPYYAKCTLVLEYKEILWKRKIYRIKIKGSIETHL